MMLQTSQAPRPAELTEDLLDAQARALLSLMRSGCTDESIARQLGISPRTVLRRIRTLMDRAGCTTRFQLGCHAQRRGWLT
ncbi:MULTISPECIES: response regulator transcription factor [unclassified Crossiella]|uniref:response regulator transcription factor n=1 Tax=unclassified Crossiella TaxID=2620835 RepID=UPI001FFEF514|nr:MULTISPECIES: LuxR C-terminal-related transcriptional regulator [unclassified Crossiella]MCK2242869.1 LuxR C-terminal-related transcriptional regulator [Crossiella sp. S99.2]MCK2256746.1 LuxR C-terminal-related transcriptional regulator [Crossiella sp. S99.1]